VGRVTAVSWPGQENLAAVLAEAADRAAPFPALGPLPDRPIRLLLAPTPQIFDSLTRGRMPTWSEGAAFPGSGTVVLLSARPSARLSIALRHELAHLMLHWSVPRHLPLWFDEGYAVYAAAEWGRAQALELNLGLALGRIPTFAGVDSALRGAGNNASLGYALAGSAVQYLARLGAERGLDPLFVSLAETGSFEEAIRRTYFVTSDGLEDLWRRDLRSRYGLLTWIVAAGAFWTVAAVLLVTLASARRRRDRERRRRLQEAVEAEVDAAPPGG
jgi:peptidase MA superfamily protein